MPGEIIVFDMDGVLVDVSASYREAIRCTVEHFTGKSIRAELVQRYKNEGGWNNDWALSQKIAADLGVEVPYQEVVAYFQKIFFGAIHDGIPDGLMAQERWIPARGMLESLCESYQVAIFTGRTRQETGMTLRRFAPAIPFHPLICAEDVTNGKPHPEGLQIIAASHADREIWYVGDTVDDARSARAAGVAFIGIAAPGAHHRDQLLALFESEGAVAILEDVNQLPEVLNRR